MEIKINDKKIKIWFLIITAFIIASAIGISMVCSVSTELNSTDANNDTEADNRPTVEITVKASRLQYLDGRQFKEGTPQYKQSIEFFGSIPPDDLKTDWKRGIGYYRINRKYNALYVQNGSENDAPVPGVFIFDENVLGRKYTQYDVADKWDAALAEKEELYPSLDRQINLFAKDNVYITMQCQKIDSSDEKAWADFKNSNACGDLINHETSYGEATVYIVVDYMISDWI